MAAKSGADSVFVHPCGKAEFVVRHYNERFPMPECRGCSICQPGGKSDYINLQGCFACNSLVLSFYLIVYAKAAAAVVRKAAHQSSKKVGRGEGIGEEVLASEDWEASNLVGSSEGRGGSGGRGGKGGRRRRQQQQQQQHCQR